MYYVIELPVEGTPILKGLFKESKLYAPLSDVVDGGIDIASGTIRIHPMFTRSEKRWDLINKMLCTGKAKLYVNDNGTMECSVNMCAVIFSGLKRVDMHLYGNIALVVPQSILDGLCDKRCFIEVEEYDEDKEEEYKSKGYECTRFQVYMIPA